MIVGVRRHLDARNDFERGYDAGTCEVVARVNLGAGLERPVHVQVQVTRLLEAIEFPEPPVRCVRSNLEQAPEILRPDPAQHECGALTILGA
jgi:hypothetical protein